MIITYPENCINPNSRWAYLYSLWEELRLWRNNLMQGKTLEEVRAFEKAFFRPYTSDVSRARITVEKGIIDQAYWKPSKAVSFIDNNNIKDIKYPSGLNQNNEGSRGAFVLELLTQYPNKSPENLEVDSLITELNNVVQTAKTSNQWKPYINLSELKHGN